MKFLVVKRSSLIIALIAALILAGAGTAVYYTDAASIYNNVSPKKVPIYSVETEEKAVALTFDAAWGADKTLGILELSRKRTHAQRSFSSGSGWRNIPISSKLSRLRIG